MEDADCVCMKPGMSNSRYLPKPVLIERKNAGAQLPLQE